MTVFMFFISSLFRRVTKSKYSLFFTLEKLVLISSGTWKYSAFLFKRYSELWPVSAFSISRRWWSTDVWKIFLINVNFEMSSFFLYLRAAFFCFRLVGAQLWWNGQIRHFQSIPSCFPHLFSQNCLFSI